MLYIELALLAAMVIGGGIFLLGTYLSELPTHDDSRRYHELWKRPDQEGYETIRSFSFRRNALRWVCEYHVDRVGHTMIVDSKKDLVIYDDL